MPDLINDVLADQYAAALRMLRSCVEMCPDDRWESRVVDMTFDQVVFHTLFFTDIYLGHTLDEGKQQGFHREHAEVFGEYEEIGGGLQKAHYDKPFIYTYFDHCRDKSRRVLEAETAEDLASTPGFEWLKFSRLEAHLYNIRHVSQHLGALSILVRRDTGKGVPWVGTASDS